MLPQVNWQWELILQVYMYHKLGIFPCSWVIAMFWALNLNCLSQGPPGPPGSVGMTGKKGELVRQSVYRLFICAPLCNFVRQWWCFDWQLAPRKLQVQISTCCPVFTVPESDICSHSKQPWTLFFTTGIALDFKFEIWTFNLPRAKCQSRMQHCVAILQSGVQTNNWFHSNCIQSPLIAFSYWEFKP